MEKENGRQDNIKIIFSIISLLLMIPPLVYSNNSYYRTLFIFLINRVIDMFFKRKNSESIFFKIWSFFNQWIGAFACAVAFCSLDPEFAKICKAFSNQINIALFVTVISCVSKEMGVLIVTSIKEDLIEEKIKSDVGNMKGESLWQE